MPILDIPTELIELRSSLLGFLDREVRPVESHRQAEIQESGTFSDLASERARIRRRSAEIGLWGAHMPAEVGGQDLPYLGWVLLHEEANRHGLVLPSVESVLPVVSGPSRVFLDCTDAQRERYLAPLMRAEKSTCFALTEPDAGSDATRIRTRATRTAPGRWTINGRKHFITGGDEADFAVVFAVTEDRPTAGAAMMTGLGITAFLVDTDTPGFSVSRIQRTMSPRHRPAELTFQDVEVSDEQILGRRGFGFRTALKGITGARLAIAAACLGAAGYLLDRSVSYARDRQAFGAAIGSFQDVQRMIVDSHAELEQARLLVYSCAGEIDGGADARRPAALAKLVATEMAGRVADRAMQVHGGNGFMTELGIEMHHRDLRATRLYEGTTEILRSNVASTLGLSSSG